MSDFKGISDELIMPFFRVMQSMDSIYEEYARKNGLTYMSMYILETLYNQTSCTQKEISEKTLYPKQTVNMVIQTFLKKEWVILEQSDNDKRSKHVTLTPLGKTFAESIFIPFYGAVNEAFSELDPGKRETMLGEMSIFVHSFIDKVKKLP